MKPMKHRAVQDDDDDDDDDGGGDDHRDKLQLVAGQRKRISLTNCVCNKTTDVAVSRKCSVAHK